MAQEWRIDRAFKKKGYTISRVFLNGERFGDGKKYCNLLEDEDRGLKQDMPLDKIKAVKIKGQTAIPAGRYRIIFTYSPKYKKQMPLVSGVPGFDGIRIHSGNSNKDTEGCLLFGVNDKVGWISNSRYWTNIVTDLIKDAINKGEDVFINIG
ncbi:DUF5675 family protein [Prevotella sp. E2-28]|uniref:DUF5675 family protein n=1 Tax=Prevotella sp. E2-28 TaxID=2913620 RepID=UPI001EDA9B52|nr:DUF5675 family protein [Prevotella sp. E2-28]UKK52651.1 DUF5675 family protein [Prevotella sp. E2-28]